MKRKPPKPKTPKSPETPPMKRTKANPTPSPEWLAAMAVQIMQIHPPTENPDVGAPSDHFQKYGFHWQDFVAVRRARSFYRAALDLLQIEAQSDEYMRERNALRQRTFLEILPKLTGEEKRGGRISYEKGCKLVTGQARPERAVDWFQRLWQSSETEYSDNPEQEGWTLDYLVTWRLIFLEERRSLKKVLAAQSAKTGQKTAKCRRR